MEQRYVLRHTPRVEPQGQENLQNNTPSAKENQARYVPDQRFSSNTSTDSTRYASSNRSISETRNPMYNQSITGTNSNRSSMDVSTCSYNTLIIHNDDNIFIGNREYPGTPDAIKKDRPRSYGEQMQEITEIPDDFLNQSHVLKHLAKEIKTPVNRRSNTRDSGMSDNADLKDPPKYGKWTTEEHNEQNNNKMKSKSQPDLTKLTDIDLEAMETILKENQLLKQQLHSCYMKVAKTQKLEEEVANIYRVHDELKQTCERREKLERAARMRLQSDLQRVQELNRVMKDQVDILQTQLSAPSEHQLLIAQLFTQNKELSAAKDRQEIELVAQRATLQEQRNHIGILDAALRNAQHNIRRLEDELRKKQLYVERLTQLHGALQSKQNEQKIRLDYEAELGKDSNRSGSSTNSDSKWQIQDKSQIMRLDSEQRHLDEQAMRQNIPKITLDKNIQDDRMITEAQHDKLRYLEEVHSAQRKVNDLQTHLKVLDSKVAEKEAEIRILQEKKICGSSFDSYNSFALNPFNSQASFNASNASFNTTTNTSLLDQTFGGNSTNFSPNQNPYVSSPSYGQQKPTYNQSSVSEKLTLEQVTKLLAQKQLEYKSTSNIILNQIQTSEEIARSCRDIASDKEEFC
ncbi:Angiomotin-like protein 1, partial [Pseudolycoriella hygida]